MAGTADALSPEEQQETWLQEGKAVVKQQAFLMKRALDNSNLKDALKYSSNMLCELRTGLLSPKNYYELYMMVADEMRHLEQYFYEEWKRGRRMVELYELVQHAGNIVPRLYLLITVGSVYIRSKEAPARDILKDLVEMCRGVQHPMRGLFLRNFLLQCARDKLPDSNSEYGDNVQDSVDFLMHNFAEMNKLWVRMQHQGPVRDRERREKERLDLRILVGTNLVRLSNLDGVDADAYKALVLPRILEQVINCKDQIAQQYLMECIIQVFPDEFHLRTLEELLEACGQLQAGVDVKGVLVGLMNRLAAFARAEPGAMPAELDMLGTFRAHVAQMSAASIGLAGVLDLQVALLNFALGLAPDRLDFVDHLLQACGDTLRNADVTRVDGAAERAVVQLLRAPLTLRGDVLTLLALSHYAVLMTYLPLPSRRDVAALAARTMLRQRTVISTAQQVDSLLDFLQPLVKDVAEDEGQGGDVDDEDMDAEQALVAALVHSMSHPDPAALYQMHVVARKHFGQGGPRRVRHTLAPLLFRTLALAEAVRRREAAGEDAGGAGCKRLLGFAMETVKGLATTEPRQALCLFLQAAQAASRCGEDKVAYEFVSQAFVVYEDEISDSKAQAELLPLFTGTLHTLAALDPDDYDTLATGTAKHAARLLRKPDQCRAVYSCACLFWNDTPRGGEEGRVVRDGKRVLDCLQRSLKIADVCMQSSASHANLFVEILDRYLLYFEAGNDKVTIKYLQGLVDLIEEHLANLDAGPDSAAVRAHMAATLEHMRRRRAADPARYEGLTI